MWQTGPARGHRVEPRQTFTTGNTGRKRPLVQLILNLTRHTQPLRTPSEQRLDYIHVSAQQLAASVPVSAVPSFTGGPRPGDKLVGHSAHRRHYHHGFAQIGGSAAAMVLIDNIGHPGKALGVGNRGAAKLVNDHGRLACGCMGQCRPRPSRVVGEANRPRLVLDLG
jgi:hypothetical protein